MVTSSPRTDVSAYVFSSRPKTSASRAGCNFGAAEATSDVLVFLNPDAVVGPSALRQLARTLDDRTIGIAMARLRLFDKPEVLNSGGTVVHVSGLACQAGRYGEPAASIGAVGGCGAAASGASARDQAKDITNALGGFTGEFFMYQEDVEFELACAPCRPARGRRSGSRRLSRV